MAYQPSSTDLRLLKQKVHSTHIKIEMLNDQWQPIGEIQGDAISASLSIDADSDIRRTCNLVMHVKTADVPISPASKIWINSYMRLYYGVENLYTGESIWYKLGIFTYTDYQYDYDEITHTLSLTCVDPMSVLTAEKGNAIGADNTIIEVNSNIRNAMISTVKTFWRSANGGKCPLLFNVTTFPADQRVVPYDLEFACGSYPVELVNQLRDIYPCNETFFDVDGIFTCQRIPSATEDVVVLDSSVVDRLLISENISNSFSHVKNTTEIWGMSLDAEYTAETCTTRSGVYKLGFNIDVSDVESGQTFGFTPNTNCVTGQKLQVGSSAACPIKIQINKSNGTVVEELVDAEAIKSGLPYVVRYVSDGLGNRYILQGELEIHCITKEMAAEPSEDYKDADRAKYDCQNIDYVINPDSPFCVERIGEYRQVLAGGEYDDIYTTELAIERARYENWKTTRLQEEINLNIFAIPWLDVNTKISYTSPSLNETVTCLVRKITFDLAASTMQINAIRFYPYYPF